MNEFGYRPVQGRKPVRVHGGKLTANILTGLKAKGLVEYDVTPEQPQWSEWLLVEENTARLYMAMLAQYLADLDTEHTVPGTDSDDDANIVYRAWLGDGFPCIETRFQRGSRSAMLRSCPRCPQLMKTLPGIDCPSKLRFASSPSLPSQ